MNSLMECSARARLCRQFAVHEPAYRAIWLAEAERWSDLADRETPGPRRGAGSQDERAGDWRPKPA